MKRLSVIVPMYNVAPYVERCIRSLEDQDIPKNDYEIICINDGSPDNSREVVLELQKEFNNLILIDQENQGVSRARNKGISCSKGIYLLFIDPDDYVDRLSFGRILLNADKYNSQVSFLGFTFLNENEIVRKQVFNKNLTSQIFSGPEAYFLARGDGSTDPDRMVAVLFKNEFFTHHCLSYLEDVPYLEDGEFIARILCLAKNCIFDGHSFYQRTTRPGSATNSKLFYSDNATNGFLNAAINLKKFQDSQDLDKSQKAFLNQPITKFVLLAISSSLTWRNRRKLLTTIMTLKRLDLRHIDLEGNLLVYKHLGRLYNLSPYFGALALLIWPRLNRIYKSLFVR